MNRWVDIGSDVNWREYGGHWARHIAGTRYHALRFYNMHDACDEPGYACELHEVDIASDRLESALDCSGFDGDGPPCDLQKVEALSSYGAYAPLWSETGSNAYALMRAAKRESRMLATDSEAYETRMGRPVNRLGMTASEYQAGDMNSAMERARLRVVRVLKHSDLQKCRFCIFLPDHYRSDGSCKCDDRDERARLIAEAGYSKADFKGIPLR